MEKERVLAFQAFEALGSIPLSYPDPRDKSIVFQSAYGLKMNCPSRLRLSACSSGSGTVWGSSADLRRCATILKVVLGRPVLFLVPWRPLALAPMSGRGQEHISLTLWSTEVEWTFPSLRCKCKQYSIDVLFILPYFPLEPSRHLSRCWIKLGSTPQTRSHGPFCCSALLMPFNRSCMIWPQPQSVRISALLC